MKIQSLRDELLRLRDEHRSVRDGGYALTKAIVAHGRSLSPDQLLVFAEALGSLVVDENARMRGAALDALADLGPQLAAPQLLGLLLAPNVSDELKDDIAQAALMLRIREAATIAIERLIDGDGRASKLGLLASLAPVHEAAFRYFASDFIANWYEKHPERRNTPGWLPTFLYHMGDGSDSLLKQLAADLSRMNPDFGDSFLQQTREYLAKPIAKETQTSEGFDRLQRQLQRA